MERLSGQLRSFIICSTGCPTRLEQFLTEVENQLKQNLITFLESESSVIRLNNREEECVGEIVTQVR